MQDNDFIRNIEGGDLLEAFLVSAVSSLLTVRFYLRLTHYPQIGGANLHIAHMLWGGLLMMAAIVMLLNFLGNKIMWAGAIIGGIGFGIFLDELGKFVTRDNNYLFQPTVAIIYIIFLLLFFIFRYINASSKLSQKEYLMNALRVLEEAVLNDMDTAEKRHFASLLRRSDQNDEVTIQLQKLLKELDVIPLSPSRLHKLYKKFSRWYHHLTQSSLFPKGVMIFFIVKTISDITSVVIFFLTYFSSRPEYLIERTTPLTLITYGQIFSTIASTIFIIIGVVSLRFSRDKAYFFFKQSLLTTIFFTQFFLFYKEQFHALTGLLFNLLLLIGIDYMITEERRTPED